jgi:hypothetical protein
LPHAKRVEVRAWALGLGTLGAAFAKERHPRPDEHHSGEPIRLA